MVVQNMGLSKKDKQKYFCKIIILISFMCGFELGAVENWQPGQSSAEQMATQSDDTRGNWYHKREYYKKAREVYGTMKDVLQSIDDFKTNIFTKHADIDKQTSQFYAELGFKQGELDEKLDALEKDLLLERERSVELTQEQRTFLADVKTKKAALEQLKKDLELVKGLDGALGQSISRVLEKTSEARKYERTSWRNYNQIPKEFSDQKIEQLYKEIETNLENVQAISKYLSGDLNSFFDQKNSELNSRMQTVRSEVTDLKNVGVELAKKIEASERDDMLKRKKEVADLRAELKKTQEEKACPAHAQDSSWLTRVWGYVKNFFGSAYDWMSGLAHKIFTSKETVKKQEIKQDFEQAVKTPAASTDKVTLESVAKAVIPMTDDTSKQGVNTSDIQNKKNEQ